MLNTVFVKENKTILILIGFIFFATKLFTQNIVINEILYDPEGADTGFEWIELYNNSDSIINLENWKIELAGTEFESVFTFPEIYILPYSFILIGEENVENANIFTSLAFQNGGSSTDGVRIISADENYTDTILYDEPNDNSLPDDTGNPAEFFADDVPSGITLARIQDGLDTNNCASDFLGSETPTPGFANAFPVDLALESAQITQISDEYEITFTVSNLSTFSVDNSNSNVDIYLNFNLLATFILPEIPAGNTIEISENIGSFLDDYYAVSISLNYLHDNNLENNTLQTSILVGQSFIIINEILFKPESGNQEWVEIYLRNPVDNFVDNLVIEDAAGGKIRFSNELQTTGYFVICSDNFSLQNYYNLPDTLNIIEATSWATLNNGDEILYLKDSFGTILDSTSYSFSDFPENFSYERVDPYQDENVMWEISQAELGATPTVENSVLPQNMDAEIIFTKLIENENTFEHQIYLLNSGLENISEIDFTCEYRLSTEQNYTTIFEKSLQFEDSLLYTFDTDKFLDGYVIFKYEIFNENDQNPENNITYSFFNNQALPFVINEIMYNPDTDNPEWIELKINDLIPEISSIMFVTDNDTIYISNSGYEYILLTDSEEDALTLSLNYDLGSNMIFSGLNSLSNLGEQLILLDEINNVIENFSYDPDWNDDKKGISIERINPTIFASVNNWGPSVKYCTPGKRNSIFVQNLPATSSLEINPNPFSPYRNEHTIITYLLPEKISTTTIRIFDLKGRMVNKLINQTQVASNGEFIWDGKDENRKKLPVGVYIIKMDATSRENEKVFSKVKTVVIGK